MAAGPGARGPGATRQFAARHPWLAAAGASLLCLAALLVGAEALAREGIVSFDSDITVHADGSMTVRETIVVEAERRSIRRGIYRDFPTTYRDRRGNRITVDFEVREVVRNGRAEPHRTERRSNGVRIYIGDKDVIIPRGRHAYVITYRTDRQLGFFEGFDELYWNVTGNAWAFEIERATALVRLPGGARAIRHAAYTGPQGAQGQDFTYSETPGGSPRFATTGALAPGEGLTIAVAWPPGFVARPTEAQRLAYFLRDNGVLIAGLIGVAMVLIYFVPVWLMVGRDPEKGVIVPEYEPPPAFSPAAARYVTRMGLDDKTFTAAVVSMAVKGFLTIYESALGTFTLIKTGRDAKLSRGESALARKLFSRGRTSIELKQSNHKTLQAARKALHEALRTEFEKIYFLRNTQYFIPGVGLSVVAVGMLVLASDRVAEAAFLAVWLGVWSFAVYFLFCKLRRIWLGTARFSEVMSAIVFTLLALPFFGGEIFALSAFAGIVSVPAAAVLAAVVLINFLFYHLLKAPTALGRRAIDRIEGFKQYLSVAEKDRMNLLNPPERTPELFERFLPYALALGVEQAWSEQFSGILARAGAPEAGADGHYRPNWYSGRGFDRGLGGFASSLGSGFAGAIAAASTAPGSSSGSGGGGFSGGGGGGGGGGGW